MKIKLFEFITTGIKNFIGTIIYRWFIKKKDNLKDIQFKPEQKITSDTSNKGVSIIHKFKTVEEIVINDNVITLVDDGALTGNNIQTLEEIILTDNNVSIMEEVISISDNNRIAAGKIITEDAVGTSEEIILKSDNSETTEGKIITEGAVSFSEEIILKSDSIDTTEETIITGTITNAFEELTPGDTIKIIEEIIITADNVTINEKIISKSECIKNTEDTIITDNINNIAAIPENSNIKAREGRIIVDSIASAIEEKTSGDQKIKTTEEIIIRDSRISIIEETIITDNTMNTVETESKVKATGTFIEFNYLKILIDYRINNPTGQQLPEMPAVEEWNLPIKKFIKEHHLDNDQDTATLLLIGLTPHAVSELFDVAIQDKLRTSGDFPEIGGVRGKNFRGFLPTGQTAVYLLTGYNLEKRKEIEQLFWSDKYLAKKKILWLEELPQGEPVMSGKITMALDYVDLFLFGASAPPHFSTSFPAKRITTKLTPDDIVMNDEVRRHYENLKDWIDASPTLKHWDKKERFKNGFRVLFYGPPGTGKTLTANVLGNERGKHVYKIDLSMVVSKYIGETEKNLELLFARAEDKDWILFFDEADAIFGKRTNVRDAHDKYANQEVSYLLQRIEEFNGLVILATNKKDNIDGAFIRRFDDIVKFTLPNENERKEIWEKSFPEESDIGDIPNKVKKYELAGGNIINVIYYAAIQAVKKKKVLAGKKELVSVNQQSSEKESNDPKKIEISFRGYN